MTRSESGLPYLHDTAKRQDSRNGACALLRLVPYLSEKTNCGIPNSVNHSTHAHISWFVKTLKGTFYGKVTISL